MQRLNPEDFRSQGNNPAACAGPARSLVQLRINFDKLTRFRHFSPYRCPSVETGGGGRGKTLRLPHHRTGSAKYGRARDDAQLRRPWCSLAPSRGRLNILPHQNPFEGFCRKIFVRFFFRPAAPAATPARQMAGRARPWHSGSPARFSPRPRFPPRSALRSENSERYSDRARRISG